MPRLSAILAAATLGLAAATFAPAAYADDHAMMMEGGSATIGDLQLTGAWTRATPPAARAGGGYLKITNNGSKTDYLVSGSVDFAERVEIHEMSVINDVMKMRHLEDGLPVPPGETVALEPGSYHVMFMGMTEPLTEGKAVDVTLTFKNAGDVTIKMPVAKVGARSLAGDGGGMMHDHGNMDMQKSE
ncbi:hypothetical protein GGD81_003735 [Rhodobium orientis]|uniref:Copper chaperone PCu(A)C n=1 Tax=Rhodobium orientis TaxID=34017 RepID=A0A327JN39_9HYPH|nr:copper chaperone PCu(A)C [Rhodobium orientis]MBB4304673.1 hypothetical protein [Rhodobium orientis]MBK5950048.1 hypothetical protein [Rhodobium orientis]RAI27737.1 hypothetical protein CH339_09330 [Rhodobium orientis]